MKLQRDPTTHKLQRHATSHKIVRATAGDGCCCGGVPFNNCIDLGIICAKVTIADMVLCPDLTDGGGFLVRQSLGDPNREYLIPVCGTDGSSCFLRRSFCDVTSYGSPSVNCGTLYTWGLSSAINIQMEVFQSGINQWTTNTTAVLQHQHTGCCHWEQDHLSSCFETLDDGAGTVCAPTPPPDETYIKECPCPENPSTIFLGGSLGGGDLRNASIYLPYTSGSPSQGPIIIGDSHVSTGHPTSWSFAQGSVTCGTTHTATANYASNYGTVTIEMKYSGDSADCPHDDDDEEFDCGTDCNCGEEDI